MDSGLLPKELKVMDSLKDVWNYFIDLPVQDSDDVTEFRHALHLMEHLIMIRGQRRAFSGNNMMVSITQARSASPIMGSREAKSSILEFASRHGIDASRARNQRDVVDAITGKPIHVD